MAFARKRCEYTGVTLELSSIETAQLFALLRDHVAQMESVVRHVQPELRLIYKVLRDIIGGPGKEVSEYR